MTQTQAKELLPILTAFSDGKEIDFLLLGKWMPCGPDHIVSPAHQYRIKPTLRPWRGEEIPLGAWIRRKETPYLQAIIGVRDILGLGFKAQADYYISTDSALANYEHSTDLGVTWKPCGV